MGQVRLNEFIHDTLKCIDTVHELRKKFMNCIGPANDTYVNEKAVLRSCEILLCELEESLRGNDTPHTRQLVRKTTSYSSTNKE